MNVIVCHHYCAGRWVQQLRTRSSRRRRAPPRNPYPRTHHRLHSTAQWCPSKQRAQSVMPKPSFIIRTTMRFTVSMNGGGILILSTCMVGCIEWGQRAYAHSGSTPNAAATSPSASISFQSIRSCCCLRPNGRWLMLPARSQTCSNLGAAAARAPLQLCPSGTCASTRGSSNRTATASSVVFKAVRSP